MNQANAHFADQVKYLRFKLRISQATLAKELGAALKADTITAKKCGRANNRKKQN